MKRPLIFDIKRYAINDGPGIRVSVFFKGCPLSCLWCHNPESQSPKPEKMYTSSKCIGAKDCIEVCPENALVLTSEGIISDKELCNLCGKCADSCPTKAIEMSGKEYSPEALLKEILKEKVHMEHSNGGVTFTGGEPLMHAPFLMEMLRLCEKENIHTVLDTSGFAPTDVLLETATYTDLYLYDLKHMDSEIHKKWTGVDNHLILKNLVKLSGTGTKINIRIPLISNVNNDRKSLSEMASFLQTLPGLKPTVNLLPYHNIGRSKHEKLGISFNEMGMGEPSSDEQKEALKLFEEGGFVTELGG